MNEILKSTIEIDFYSSIDFPDIGEIIERNGHKYKVIDNAVRNVTTAELVIEDKPEDGKIYALTGSKEDKAISNGNTWAESEVKEKKQATIAERNRAIKKELIKQYGKEVIVQGHRGTAYGWLDIRVTLPVPAGHVHEMNEYGRCKSCWELGRKEETNVRAVCHKVAKEIGSYIGSYCSDDGYNTERDNILCSVEYK